MRTVLITGGSQGIGFELARCFASEGASLILAARDPLRLADARTLLQNEFHVRVETVQADLSSCGEAEKLYDKVKDRNIGVLVNNAGCGYTGYSWQIDTEKEERMAVLNDVSLMTLCKLFLRDFTEKKEGIILNVASTGAFQPGPYIAGYYASKAFVLSYSEAIAEEAKPYGVRVYCLCPGPADTDFYMKSGGKKPKLIMSAEKAARYAYEHLDGNKTVLVPGISNKLARMVPKRIRTAFVRNSKQKNLKKRKRDGNAAA